MGIYSLLNTYQIDQDGRQMKKSNLNDHADQILGLLRRNATNEQIVEILLAKPFVTSLEAVRKWVKINADPAALERRSKGRRKIPDQVCLRFVPDISSEVTIPLFLESILEMFAGTADSRQKARLIAAAHLFQEAGIQIDLTISPKDWMLPARALSSLSDLELTCIVYLLSDRPGPPTRGRCADAKNWLHDLMATTSRLKANIKRGIDFTIAELG